MSVPATRLAVALALATCAGACGGGTGAPAAPVTTGGGGVSSIRLAVASSHILWNHSTQATAAPLDAQGNPVVAPVTYTSSDASTLVVSPGGLVFGEGIGTASVIASSGTVSSSAQVLVTLYEFPTSAVVKTGSGIFTPSQVDIHVGGTVEWQFNATGHTVVFDALPGAPANIQTTTNANVTRTFATVGTYQYQCSIHLGMTGVVAVHATS